tara:strand:- start:340 stop:462 length:123 start_codon:yes stop_codon:yes gene_type:complete
VVVVVEVIPYVQELDLLEVLVEVVLQLVVVQLVEQVIHHL